MRIAFLIVTILSFTACQQKMANQPSYKPLQPSKAFANGRSARLPVTGTISRGELPAHIVLTTGRKVGADGQPQGEWPLPVVQPAPGSPEASRQLGAEYDAFVSYFPVSVDETMLQQGRDRYTILCAICHDPLGTGYGKIVERGYTAPPSYHIERLRRVPVGYLFAVVRQGYGSMPSYGDLIPMRERWAIVAYVRALQQSQHYPEDRLTAAMRAEQARQQSPPAARPDP